MTPAVERTIEAFRRSFELLDEVGDDGGGRDVILWRVAEALVQRRVDLAQPMRDGKMPGRDRFLGGAVDSPRPNPR